MTSFWITVGSLRKDLFEVLGVWMKNQSKLYIAVAIVITLTLGHINFWLRAPDVESFRAGQTGPDVVAQLDGLSDSLDKGDRTGRGRPTRRIE